MLTLALLALLLMFPDDGFDVDDVVLLCGFLDAGPLFTPGFNPVCVFGEFDPLPPEFDPDEC